jgi:hypothetical protein
MTDEMKPFVIELPAGSKVHYAKYNVCLRGGKTGLTNKEMIKDILTAPNMESFNAQDAVDFGYFTADEVRSFGHEAHDAGSKKEEKKIEITKEEIKVPEYKPTDFALMGMQELREHAERLNVVIRRSWDKDKIVEALAFAEKKLNK